MAHIIGSLLAAQLLVFVFISLYGETGGAILAVFHGASKGSIKIGTLRSLRGLEIKYVRIVGVNFRFRRETGCRMLLL